MEIARTAAPGKYFKHCKSMSPGSAPAAVLELGPVLPTLRFNQDCDQVVTPEVGRRSAQLSGGKEASMREAGVDGAAEGAQLLIRDEAMEG